MSSHDLGKDLYKYHPRLNHFHEFYSKYLRYLNRYSYQLTIVSDLQNFIFQLINIDFNYISLTHVLQQVYDESSYALQVANTLLNLGY